MGLTAEALAGFTAGLTATTLLHPIDAVKIRQQASHEASRHRKLSSLAMAELMMKQEGVKGLYRGLTPNVVGNSASWALHFVWYDVAKRILQRTKQTPRTPLNSSDYLFASAFSSITTSTLTNPIWLLKTRMLTSPTAFPLLTHVNQIYTSSGLLGFYKCLSPSLFGTVTFSIQFTVYERLKALRGASTSKDLGTLDYVTFSAAAKIVAGVITYPYQVLRTRMQMYGLERGIGLGELSREIWAQDGARGFYRGIGPSVLRVLPSTCVTFLVYEWARERYKGLLG